MPLKNFKNAPEAISQIASGPKPATESNTPPSTISQSQGGRLVLTRMCASSTQCVIAASLAPSQSKPNHKKRLTRLVAPHATIEPTEPVVAAPTSTTSRFQGDRLIISRMSAPSERTAASLSPSQSKPNPKKRLASLVAPYAAIQPTEPMAPASAATSGNKRKRSSCDDYEQDYDLGDEHQYKQDGKADSGGGVADSDPKETTTISKRRTSKRLAEKKNADA